MSLTHPLKPFSIPNPHEGRWSGLAVAGLCRAVEGVLGLRRLNRLYAAAERNAALDGLSFVDRALATLGIGYDVSDDDLGRMPADGGIVVVANHPHGALDGLVLASLAGRRRPDVRLLGNHLLARIPDLRPLCLFIDPFGDRRSTGRNAAGLREALAWVRGGGALLVFPAGEVSHARWRGPVTDPLWRPAVARLIELSQAPAVPVHIEGANSRLFQVGGLVHPRVRTILLARELLRQQGQRVRVRVGEAIPASALEALPTPAMRTSNLRLRTYALVPSASPAVGCASNHATAPVPVVAEVSADVLAREIAALPGTCTLVTHGAFRVICARARQAPSCLREIGRLREVTFRAAGEGTGRAIDLDRFDQGYRHLFVWNDDRCEIAGAYRLGATDELSALVEPRQLYTRSLFSFGGRFLSKLGPALELGRSFVRAEYQRDYGTLLLLWKGIGRFVSQAPRYRCLFGPVSISADHRPAARELLVAALSTPRFRSPLAELVRPMRPFQSSIPPDAVPVGPGIDQLDRELAAIDDGRSMPVLLRQYLKLNARLVAFSVDPAFGGVVDGLAVVDLLDVNPAILQRYMTRDGVAAFHAWHRRPETPGHTRPATASA